MIKNKFNNNAGLGTFLFNTFILFPLTWRRVGVYICASFLFPALIAKTFPTAEDYMANLGYDKDVTHSLTDGKEARIIEDGWHRAAYIASDTPNLTVQIALYALEKVENYFFPNNKAFSRAPFFIPEFKSSYAHKSKSKNQCDIHLKENDYLPYLEIPKDVIKKHVLFHELRHCSQPIIRDENATIHHIFHEADADYFSVKTLKEIDHIDIIDDVIYSRAITNWDTDSIHDTSLYLYMKFYTSIEPTPEMIIASREGLHALYSKKANEEVEAMSIFGIYRLELSRIGLERLTMKKPSTITPDALEKAAKKPEKMFKPIPLS